MCTGLESSRQRPLRVPADLAKHVLLDFETILYGRPCTTGSAVRCNEAAEHQGCGMATLLALRTGDRSREERHRVAVGKWPHLSEHLHEGTLVAPLGASVQPVVGAFTSRCWSQRGARLPTLSSTGCALKRARRSLAQAPGSKGLNCLPPLNPSGRPVVGAAPEHGGKDQRPEHRAMPTIRMMPRLSLMIARCRRDSRRKPATPPNRGPRTLKAWNFLKSIPDAPATSGANERTTGTKRAIITVLPP